MAIAYRSDADLGRVRIDSMEHGASDDVRTAQTVARMRRHIRTSSTDPVVRNVAATIRANAASDAPADLVAGVFAWLKRNVRFVHDPPNTELLIEPAVLLRLPAERRAGDCDDFTMAAGALLKALAIESEIVTIKADAADPSRFSHVYLEALLPNGERIAVDASHGPAVGWAVPEPYGLQRWGGSMLISHAGLGLGDGPEILAPVNLPQGARWDRVLDVGLTFADRLGQGIAQRVAVPRGTAISTPTGMIARQDPNALVGPILPSVSLGGGANYLPWIIGGVLAVVAVKALSR